jgi:DNA-binding transcriptional regulator GbsR (MarR family)
MKSTAQPLVDASPSLTNQTVMFTDFEHECAEFFAEVVAVFGARRSVGQIYGIVFSSPKPLSFTDIVGRLGISKGSASQGLSLLRSLGAVRSTDVHDDRREYFVAELGLRRLVDGALRERIGPLVKAAPARIAKLRSFALREGSAQEFCIEQVEQLETWRRRLKIALPLLSALLGPPRRKR